MDRENLDVERDSEVATGEERLSNAARSQWSIEKLWEK